MDADMPTVPMPTIRSAITVARAGPTPALRSSKATPQPIVPRITTRPTTAVQPNIRCPLCCCPHRLSHCRIFKGMPPPQRQRVAQAHGHCLSCLAPTHTTQECTPGHLCQVCMLPHHTMLHRTTNHEAGRHPTPRTWRGNVRLQRQQQRNRGSHIAEPRSRHRSNSSQTRRYRARSPSRRPSGLSTVVATLQQLQRLLG